MKRMHSDAADLLEETSWLPSFVQAVGMELAQGIILNNCADSFRVVLL